MSEIQEWHRKQKAMQTAGKKTKAPEEWRRKRIGAIKAKVNQFGIGKETYYSEIARLDA